MKAETVYRLELMVRALGRGNAELHGFRPKYEACAFYLAARIISGDYQ